MGASSRGAMEPAIKICIIGSGNVATHLAVALARIGDVVQIYSRCIENARHLAGLTGTENVTDRLDRIVKDADYYIVAVKDDAIAEVAVLSPDTTGIWAHTSGSVPMDVFAPYKCNYGVFYPLQTFSRDTEIDVSRVPMFIEGNDEAAGQSLTELARKISSTVRYADSDLRKRLHVAAVFACNFVNLMWIEADELLRGDGLDITFLMPLLEETLRKIERNRPSEVMTGPARRGDEHVIGEHLKMLSGERHDIYTKLSQYILKRYEQD